MTFFTAETLDGPWRPLESHSHGDAPQGGIVLWLYYCKVCRVWILGKGEDIPMNDPSEGNG